MELRERLHQRKPEAGAVMASGVLVRDLTEGRQRDREVLGGHADAGVGHGEREAAVADALGPDGDAAAARSELDRVAEQVEQDVADRALVREERRQPRSDLAIERNLTLARAI